MKSLYKRTLIPVFMGIFLPLGWFLVVTGFFYDSGFFSESTFSLISITLIAMGLFFTFALLPTLTALSFKQPLSTSFILGIVTAFIGYFMLTWSDDLWVKLKNLIPFCYGCYESFTVLPAVVAMTTFLLIASRRLKDKKVVLALIMSLVFSLFVSLSIEIILDYPNAETLIAWHLLPMLAFSISKLTNIYVLEKISLKKTAAFIATTSLISIIVSIITGIITN